MILQEGNVAGEATCVFVFLAEILFCEAFSDQ
jgi:hypothetical protein